MDFEFKKDILDGSYRAEFSQGHEAIGLWLIEEIGKDKQKLAAILGAAKAHHDNLQTWTYQGDQWRLQIENNEVHIQAISLLEEKETEAYADILDEVEFVETQNFDPDDMLDEYPDESEAFCGVEDFEQMLESWDEFVR